jgi:hypothetical protein
MILRLRVTIGLVVIVEARSAFLGSVLVHSRPTFSTVSSAATLLGHCRNAQLLLLIFHNTTLRRLMVM